MSLLFELKERIETTYAEHLPTGVDLKQDALLLAFDSGLAMELRFASAEEYSIAWLWGDAELRIDTAPRHAGLKTWPNHFHDEEGQVRDDPLTMPGADAWDNVRKVIDATLVDPLLHC